VPKKVAATDKNIEGKSSYEWLESTNHTVVFKDIQEFSNERLKIEIKDKQNDKLL